VFYCFSDAEPPFITISFLVLLKSLKNGLNIALVIIMRVQRETVGMSVNPEELEGEEKYKDDSETINRKKKVRSQL
jgi:hypothetical protein